MTQGIQGRRKTMDRYLARARERLLRSRNELLKQRGAHREGEEELLGVREPDPGDAAAAEGGAIPLDSLNESEQARVAEIEAALSRIDDGTYGTCEQCDEPIGMRRLEAVPWTRRCFTCETEHEKEHRAAHTV
jgi:DnaK suppressor protein